MKTATLAYDQLLCEFGVDIPLDQKSGDATLVPDRRFRFSIGIHF